MRSAPDWATEIINYLQKNPVKTLLEIHKQIQNLVEKVQIDAMIPAPANGNDTVN